MYRDVRATGTDEEILEGLRSTQWSAIKSAVERAGERLKTRAPEIDAKLADRIVELVEHPKWEVRKAVAEAIQYLDRTRFHLAAARLVEDDHSYVRDAAHRSVARHTDLTRANVLKTQHQDVLARWLSDLELQHGTNARSVALRVAERFSGLLVRQARHEIFRVLAPLDASLLSLTATLERDEMDREACLAHVATAQRRLVLLKKLVQALHDFTAEVSPELHGESLSELLQETVSLVSDRMQRSTITVEIALAEDIRFEADRHRLLLAFSNILDNAFEAFEPASIGRIEISGRRDGDQVRVSFVDHGRGMSTEVCRDAFELYTTSKREGIGFGLPFARKIIEAEHGGSVTLASVPKEGTTVTVVLPIEQEQR